VSWYRWPIKTVNPVDGSVTVSNTGEVYSMWPHYWKTRWPSLADYVGKKVL
jgi:hypothetical protein